MAVPREGEGVGTGGTTEVCDSGVSGRPLELVVAPGGIVAVVVVVLFSAGGRPDTTELSPAPASAEPIDKSLFPVDGGKASL